MFGVGIRTLAEWQVYIGWRNLHVSVRVEVWVSSEMNSPCLFIWFTVLSVWFPSFEQWGIDLFGMAYNCRVYTRLECSFLMIYYAGGLMCCSWKVLFSTGVLVYVDWLYLEHIPSHLFLLVKDHPIMYRATYLSEQVPLFGLLLPSICKLPHFRANNSSSSA